MSEDRRKVEAIYGGKLRVRACGLLKRSDGALLCALHRGVGPAGRLWVPPGGGVEFGETLAQTLAREFAEEAGLAITVGPLVAVFEFVESPLHAIELFYEVAAQGGSPTLGQDPEWPADEPPLLEALAWVTPAQAAAEPAMYHGVVRQVLLGQPA